MNHVLQLVRDTLENEKISAEEQLQLTKICELEDEFVKDFSRKKWIEYFNKKGQKIVLADSLTGKGINETTRQIQKIMEEDMQKMADKGRIGRKIRVMIVGIPNVGKSSFINRIAKKTSAEVGNRPGVTKRKQ